jgi:hypothetical protein
VDLKVNGALVATDTTAPYAFTWDSSKVANGSATLSAVAYDAAGNAATSTNVNVTVSNGAPTPTTTNPPTVAIVSPGNGVKVNGNVSIQISASSTAGTTSLTDYVYVDDVLKCAGSGGSLSCPWNTRKALAGTHTIKAVAKDSSGNSATASIQVTK